jgi:hypothetical protein
MPGSFRLKLGTLEDTAVIDPKIHVWTSKKQDWYQLPDGIQAFETQPEMKDLIGK